MNTSYVHDLMKVSWTMPERQHGKLARKLRAEYINFHIGSDFYADVRFDKEKKG